MKSEKRKIKKNEKEEDGAFRQAKIKNDFIFIANCSPDSYREKIKNDFFHRFQYSGQFFNVDSNSLSSFINLTCTGQNYDIVF